MALSRKASDWLLTLDTLDLPLHVVQPWLTQLRDRSAVMALSPERNLPYGDSRWYAFSDHQAQYVGEGQPKVGSEVVVEQGEIKTFTFQKTIRLPEKTIEAAAAHNIEIVNQMLPEMTNALALALDLGVFHAIDPKSGAKVPRMEPGLDSASPKVTPAVIPSSVDSAIATVLGNGYVPDGIALDPSFAGVYATARTGLTEQRLYPNFAFTGVGELDGLRSVVTKSVSAQGIEVPADNPLIRAIIGDWNAIAWGVVRQLRVETFTSGNPDNVYDAENRGRDLAGYNEVAFRVEIDYAWGVKDPKAFALVAGDVSRPTGGLNATNAVINATAAEVDVHGDTVNVDGGTEATASPFSKSRK
jgi:hypothetical protein